MFKRLRFLLPAMFLLLFSLKPVHANLSAFGPINPQNGYPLWYQDSNGLALEIGLDPLYNAATFDPVDPNNPFSVQIGFGSEAFYWLASSTVDLIGVGNRGVLTLGLEAAFAGLSAIDGEQFVFTRIRIVVDAPVSGTYVVTHPYGVDVFENVQAGPRAIRSVIDVGSFSPDFSGALTSRVGPFLTPADPNIVQPPGFIADVNVLQTVQGSPFGTNYFRIDGPPGSNLDGNGNDFVQTDLFSLSGKIYTGIVPSPLAVQRATYQRTASGNVDVFATSAPGATLSFSGTGIPQTAMVGDGAGKFFGQANLADASSLPPFVTVTADNPPNTTTTNNRLLVDVVTLTRADYDVTAKTLSIKANSGDVFASPTLTATGFGPLVNGSLVVNNVNAPPANVGVTSSSGGSDTQIVNVVNPPSEILTLTRAFFRTIGNTWLASGTDSVITTADTITIHHGGLNGQVIGVVQSSPTGVWNFNAQNSTVIPNQGDTISLESSNGATLTGVPVTIIRR